MILRIAALGAVMLGLSLFVAYLHWIGRGPLSTAEDRHLREMKERTTAPDSIAPYTFAGFAALPHGRPLTEVATLEQRGVSLEGYVRQMFLSNDGDYHLSISSTPGPEGLPDTMTVTAELTPEFSRGSTSWSWEPLSVALRAWLRGLPPWRGGVRRARISGWLLYDFQYDEPFMPRKAPILPGSRARRLTGWEIHPVTRIELWDDSLARFVDYPR